MVDINENLDKTNVVVPVTGMAFIGPEMTTAVTSYTDTPPVGFSPFGYFSTDGAVISDGTSTTPINAWQNNDVVARLKDADAVTLAFTAMETQRSAVKAAWYGNSNQEYTGESGGAKSIWLYLEYPSTGKTDLFIFPSVEKQPGGDRTFVSTDVAQFPFTFDVFRKFGYFYKELNSTSGS